MGTHNITPKDCKESIPTMQLILPRATIFAIAADLLGHDALPQLLQGELLQHLVIKKQVHDPISLVLIDATFFSK